MDFAQKEDMNSGEPGVECYVLNVSITKVWVEPNPHEVVLAGGALWEVTRLRGQNAHEWEERPYLIKRSQRAFWPLWSQEDTVRRWEVGSHQTPDLLGPGSWALPSPEL